MEGPINHFPIYYEEVPYTKADGKEARVEVPLYELPAGTLLFRGVQLPNPAKDEDPRLFVRDWLGYPVGDRFCMTPTKNTFFYTTPYVPFGAHTVGEWFNAIMVYQIVKDVRIVSMISPSKWVRGGRDIKLMDGTAPVQRCDKFDYTCIEKKDSAQAKKEKELSAWDNCIHPAFARDKKVSGWMAIADYDSLDNFKEGATGSKTTMGKYIMELEARLPGKGVDLLTSTYTDETSHRGFPEVVLFPWSPHPGAENQYIEARTEEDAADAIAEISDQFNYLPMACITERGIVEAFTGDFKAGDLPKYARTASPGAVTRKAIDAYQAEYLNRLMKQGIDIPGIGRSYACFDPRTGFYVMDNMSNKLSVSRVSSDVIDYKSILMGLKTPEEQEKVLEYKIKYRSYYPAKLLENDTLLNGDVVKRMFTFERPDELYKQFKELSIRFPSTYIPYILSATETYQRNQATRLEKTDAYGAAEAKRLAEEAKRKIQESLDILAMKKAERETKANKKTTLPPIRIPIAPTVATTAAPRLATTTAPRLATTTTAAPRLATTATAAPRLATTVTTTTAPMLYSLDEIRNYQPPPGFFDTIFVDGDGLCFYRAVLKGLQTNPISNSSTTYNPTEKETMEFIAKIKNKLDTERNTIYVPTGNTKIPVEEYFNEKYAKKEGEDTILQLPGPFEVLSEEEYRDLEAEKETRIPIGGNFYKMTFDDFLNRMVSPTKSERPYAEVRDAAIGTAAAELTDRVLVFLHKLTPGPQALYSFAGMYPALPEGSMIPMDKIIFLDFIGGNHYNLLRMKQGSVWPKVAALVAAPVAPKVQTEIPIVRTMEEAIEIGMETLQQANLEDMVKPTTNGLHYKKGGPWEINEASLRITLKYIFDKLHHSCYMLCVKNHVPSLFKLEGGGIPSKLKQILQEEIATSDTKKQSPYKDTKGIENINVDSMRVMQCIIKPYKEESTTATEWLTFLQTPPSPNFMLPNGVFILNLTDAVLLREDVKEPWVHFTPNPVKLDPEYRRSYFLPILSYSGANGYDDIPIPNFDDIFEVKRKGNGSVEAGDTFKEWSQKTIQKAVFRGGTTGCGYTPETNQRLALTSPDYLASLRNKDMLDVGITTITTQWKMDPVYGLGKVDPSAVQKVGTLTMQQQSKYKYIIHVDGNVFAYRLLKTMLTGSLIIRIKSDYTGWADNTLIGYDTRMDSDSSTAHYVSATLETLDDVLTWCKENDSECAQIAENGRRFATEALSNSFIYTSFVNILNDVVSIALQPVASGGGKKQTKYKHKDTRRKNGKEKHKKTRKVKRRTEEKEEKLVLAKYRGGGIEPRMEGYIESTMKKMWKGFLDKARNTSS